MKRSERDFLLISLQYNLFLKIKDVLQIKYPTDIEPDRIFCSRNKNQGWRTVAKKTLMNSLYSYCKNHSINGYVFRSRGDSSKHLTTKQAENIIKTTATEAKIQEKCTRKISTGEKQTFCFVTSQTIRNSAIIHSLIGGEDREKLRKYVGITKSAFNEYVYEAQIAPSDAILLHLLD